MRAAALAAWGMAGLVLADAQAQDPRFLAEVSTSWLQVSQVSGPNPGLAPAGLRAEPLFFAVTVNGAAQGDSLLLRLEDGSLLAPASDWERWRLRKPTDVEYVYDGRTYHALNHSPGFSSEVSDQTLQAQLSFAPAAFESSRISARRRAPVRPQAAAGLGAYLNYEFVGTRRESTGLDPASNLNNLMELGVFNGWGVGTGQWLGQNLTDETGNGISTEGRRYIRLETAWTRDLPDDMETLRVGDAVGASGLWGRPLRYGGLRWSRNFGTQPGFVTLPQPSFSGETALPSALDLYINGLRRQTLQVPAGPFELDDVPTFTGQGDVQLVVRDLLGREQVLSESYITGANQLKAGLHDFSYEAGFTREEFARESNEYGDFFASTTQRYGLNNDLTGELRLEGSQDVQALGMGAIFALPPLGVVSNAIVVSNSDAGIGTLNTFSFRHLRARGPNFGLRLQLASDNYSQLGLAPGAKLPSSSLAANIGYSLRPVGTLGLAYLRQVHASPLDPSQALTATFSRGFRYLSFSLFASERIEPTREHSFGLSLSVPLGNRQSAAAGYRQRDLDTAGQSASSYARLQRNLPQDEGYGYRVLVNESHSDFAQSTSRGEVGAFLNAAHGSYGLEASTTEDINTYRATVGGSIGTLGGHTFASRRLNSSFAVVEAGAPDIELLVNNRPAATTNADGVAVLPRLQPYQDNVVKVNTAKLPMDVELRSPNFSVAPYYRSGVLVELDARRTLTALITLKQADGEPVPAGAVVTILGTDAEFPVGRNGLAYLSDLDAGANVIEVRWNGTRCPLSFDLPGDAGAQPRLGPFQCPGSTP